MSAHEHEVWQIRRSYDGSLYCASCGDRVESFPAAPSEPPAVVHRSGLVFNPKTFRHERPEPPAEAQQDDERCCPKACPSGACETCPCCSAGWCVMGIDGLPDDPEDLALWLEVAAEHNPVAAALAARPSADTERLLASVMRKLIADEHAFLALSTHRSESGMPVQFTLDDTTVGLTDAEADAVRTEADCPALAARPSADTETLRRVRELLSVDGVPLHDSKRISVAALRAALDGDRPQD